MNKRENVPHMYANCVLANPHFRSFKCSPMNFQGGALNLEPIAL